MGKMLIMQVNDLYWGIPFLIIIFFTVKHFMDSFFTVYIKPVCRDRELLLDFISTRDPNTIDSIMSSKDPLVSSVTPVVSKGFTAVELEGKDNFKLLKRNLKERLYRLVRIEIPHKEFLNYYAGAIILVGYFGNLIANFLMFSNFGVNSNNFLEHFKSMAIGIKSCFFGVIGVIIIPLGNIYLETLLKKRKLIVENFYKAIISRIDRSHEEAVE